MGTYILTDIQYIVINEFTKIVYRIKLINYSMGFSNANTFMTYVYIYFFSYLI